MPGGSRSCLAVRLPDELLAAVPSECDRDEDHGEPDAPGRRDQLLAGRVGERCRAVDVLVRQRAELTAWLTPAPPGVTDTTFASELPPATLMIVWKVTGIP